MKLKIENYKCISQMNFELDENKLNFIYGISGSGKTSISETISSKLEEKSFSENCKSVGSTGDIEVKLENTSINRVNIFNENSIRDFIFDKKSDGIYEVIYRPSEELVKLNKRIQKFKNDEKVKEIRNILIQFQYNFDQLKDQLKINHLKTGKLSSNVTTKALNNTKSFEISNKYNNSQITWLNKGFNEFDITNICPFCENPIENERIDEIKGLNDLKPDAIRNIQENTTILESLKITQLTLNSKKESALLQKELSDLFPINIDTKNLLKMLDNSYVDNDNIEPVPVLDTTQAYFLDNFGININEVLDELNQSKVDYLKLCKQYRGQYIANLNKNIASLNKELRKLHIPYLFEKTSKFNKDEEYKIVHVDSDKKSDLSNELSTGEKNLISLALFLIVNSDEHIIIDDPASSFDEYKRSKILQLINNNRKDNGKFTLVLSHDQIFLKFLLREYSTNWNCYIIESNIKNELRVIDPSDIDTLLNHVIGNLSISESYERKLINLRMFYEINKANSEIVYSYLSAILHGKSKEQVDNELAMISPKKTEQDVLDQIKNETGIDLGVYNTCDLTTIYDQVSNFEKIFIKRETLSKNERKIYNDVVHFNYGLIHMINPFKYDFQVKEVYDNL